MSDHCHPCSCHLSPPCGACENCTHPDDVCPEGDCQNCECIDRNPPRVAYVPRIPTARDAAWDRRRKAHDAWGCTGKPWSQWEWGYASVQYTLRPMTPENHARVVAELCRKHTYFGHRLNGRLLTIYVD